MEVATIYYKAKDGRLFTDPLECEEYERTIGILPGSVGMLIAEIEKMTDKEDYIFGIVLVKNTDNTKSVYTRVTMRLDNYLEDFVNVENLTKEQRNVYETAGNFVNTLKKLDKDLPCQYMLVFSENIDMQGPGMLANYNAEAWGKKKEG